jgi:hypothetical protein
MKAATRLLHEDFKDLNESNLEHHENEDVQPVLVDEHAEFGDIDDNMQEELFLYDPELNFVDVDCVVHVIQLAVNKFINSTPGVKKIIALAQSVAVKLRTPTPPISS